MFTRKIKMSQNKDENIRGDIVMDVARSSLCDLWKKEEYHILRKIMGNSNNQGNLKKENFISNRNIGSDPLDTPAYFRKLKFRLRFGVLVAFLVPLVTLSVYFHFQFTSTLKGSGKLNLVAIAESQRNTIDLFLQERVINIFSQFQSEGFSFKPIPAYYGKLSPKFETGQ